MNKVGKLQKFWLSLYFNISSRCNEHNQTNYVSTYFWKTNI